MCIQEISKLGRFEFWYFTMHKILKKKLLFWNYFQVKKIDLPYDKTKEQRRAFCFVEFKEEDAVKKITDQAVHKIKDQEVRIHVCL